MQQTSFSKGLAFEHAIAVVESGIVEFVVVEFVVDLARSLRGCPPASRCRGAAVFVHHDGEVVLHFLEIPAEGR